MINIRIEKQVDSQIEKRIDSEIHREVDKYLNRERKRRSLTLKGTKQRKILIQYCKYVTFILEYSNISRTLRLRNDKKSGVRYSKPRKENTAISVSNDVITVTLIASSCLITV